jgi:hypothetical protein
MEWVNEKMNAKNNNFKILCVLKLLIYLGASDGCQEFTHANHKLYHSAASTASICLISFIFH